MIIRKNFSDVWLAAGSSPVDWCEENYTVSNSIAEFTNTISNVLLVFLPIIMLAMNVWNSYMKHVSIAPIVMFLSMSFVGLSSMYFHGTLSLLGQFLDEISIAWTECFAYAVLLPKRYKPFDVPEPVSLVLVLIAGSLMTWLWFASPFLYSFWIMSATMPAFGMVIMELMVYRTQATLAMARFIVVVFSITVALWLLDKLMCGFVQNLGLPGTHQIYHISVTISSYWAITLFSFWKAQDYSVNIKSTIRYYPWKDWGVPYVHCEKYAK